jgi:16S rRNA G966 N2-methylase RsmD
MSRKTKKRFHTNDTSTTNPSKLTRRYRSKSKGPKPKGSKSKGSKSKGPKSKTQKNPVCTKKLSFAQKEALSQKIRHFSEEEILRDYNRLVEIGCNAKSKSQKVLTGNHVVDAFTFTERLNTVGKKGVSFYDLWANREKYSDKTYVKKFIEFEATHTKRPIEKVWYNLFRFYFSSINCFRPLVAMEYYCMFSPKCILDMTAGWGGRLVGACALNVPKYIGIDNNDALKEPYEKMVEFLKPHTKTQMDIRIENALTVDYSTLHYDMVFTSPPYYNIETYGNRTSVVYDTKEKWDAEFYIPLFTSTYKHLEKGGHYCLNISEDIFERVCLPLLGKPDKTFSLKKGDRQSSKSRKYSEYVYVWVGGLRPPKTPQDVEGAREL